MTIAIIAAITGVLTRSQKYFITQQQPLGNLNGHVEETLSGHNIIRAYNAESSSREEFAERNEALFNVS
ncbi:MAG: ABC transporter transmembrane domain-containing protein [Rothia sp. (in: high G+C Gram-positive bacteria)]|nr:ABC transporter transmembrane domain-containing protein [Rothia sp. (in: high G+C Gram-positive bacteria)]